MILSIVREYKRLIMIVALLAMMLSGLLFASVDRVSAAPTGLIPCSGDTDDQCKLSHLFFGDRSLPAPQRQGLVGNLIAFLFAPVLPILVSISFATIGVKMIANSSQGKSNSELYGLFWSVVEGVLIAYAAIIFLMYGLQYFVKGDSSIIPFLESVFKGFKVI